MRAAVSFLGIILCLGSPSAASAQSADGSALTEYLRLVDGILGIQVALGQASGADADARLEAAGRDFVARGAQASELLVMRSQLQFAADGLFADLDRGITAATSFPGPLPVEISRALARTLLGTVRKKFGEAIAKGENPLPALAQASKILARVRGFTDLPRELDRFADAAERAERIAATLPPPPMAGGPPTGPVAMGGPGTPPRAVGPGVPQGPGPGAAPPPSIPRAAPQPSTSGLPPPTPARATMEPAPGAAAAAAGVAPTSGPAAAPVRAPDPGVAGAPAPMAPSPEAPIARGTMGLAPGARGPAAPTPGQAPTPALIRAAAASDPVLAVLGVGEMEAEARLEGFAWFDVVGHEWPPSRDGEPDTEIELKISAPLFVLDWIEVRSAPDPTVLIWSTRQASGVQPLGIVQGGRLLNDAEGGVSGLEIEDFVVLRLYVQDDGFLERLAHPGTITITFRGGDIATIPIEPLW